MVVVCSQCMFFLMIEDQGGQGTYACGHPSNCVRIRTWLKDYKIFKERPGDRNLDNQCLDFRPLEITNKNEEVKQ